MAKIPRFQEDLFLAEFYDGMGDYIGVHDLGHAKGWATKRVKKLKETGAWESLHKYLQSTFDAISEYLIAINDRSKLEMLCMTHCKAPFDWELRYEFISFEDEESKQKWLDLQREMHEEGKPKGKAQ